mgnify:CR=1 FL=1
MATGNNYVIEVEESIDASSFYLKSVGDIIPYPYSIYISGALPNGGIVNGSYILQPEDVLENGITILADSFGDSIGSTFSDGVYTIQVMTGGDSPTVIVSTVEGFIAKVSLEVMKNSLNYRQGLDSSQRWLVQEQNRLLFLLSYAAELGLLDAFLENLDMLQKLV